MGRLESEEERQVSHHRLVILGTGPAGLTAALYAARADLEPLVVDGMQPGGQLMITTEVENFPGFPEGITGPELMARLREQAEKFGAKTINGNVTATDLRSSPKRIVLEGEELTCDALIIATGATARWLGIPSEKALMGHGVSACATCDGFFFRGKEIAVIGGGDTAMEEATFLTKFAAKVTVIHRRDALRASKAMQERARQNPKIDFRWNSVVTEVLDVAQKKVTGVRCKDVVTGREEVLPVGGLFLAIGHVPNTLPFKGQIDLDENGYVLTEPRSTRTNIAGVFAAGDVQDHVYRQAISAAGSGCMAALDAERHLAGGH
ncbi:MAG: thioredoxin-disulfide reductase [Candidatus Eisenbacteria bacterium]|nr:thioredoxin-disulfide reductase [Candidatus Eisenbacteria bacterium]